MKKVFPSDKQDQYMLRFPDGMRDRLKEEAAKNNRSMNAEIIARLEASFSPAFMSSLDDLSERDMKDLVSAMYMIYERRRNQASDTSKD